MNYLLAFDKFKDSMTAREACERAEAGLTDGGVEGGCLRYAPLTDGGEGFAEILTAQRGGELIEVEVTGPRFEKLRAQYGRVDIGKLPKALRTYLDLPAEGVLAVIEMAQASGLEKVPRDKRDPWRTTTAGTGELIAHAIGAGAAALLIGVGGSATSDIGLGALEALGLVFREQDGRPASQLSPDKWHYIEKIDAYRLTSTPPVRIACDVTNPLLGEDGAASVFGPQKGLRKEDVERLDKEAGRMADLLLKALRKPASLKEESGAGAAGGLAFGLLAATDARIVPGFDLVARWLDLEAKVEEADIVITGEGRMDRSSLGGKGPGTLIDMALGRGKEVWVFAGKVEDDVREHLPKGLFEDLIVEITPPSVSLDQALRDGPENLRKAVRQHLGR